jgi:sialic acid synthase SpsE
VRLRDIFKAHRPGNRTLRMPCVIAEAGVNHEGSMEIAKRLIDEAKEGGADGIKFQTYRADTIASRHSPAYWDTRKEPTTSQHELFRKYDRFWKGEFEELKAYCDAAEIEFLSTPFDLESAHFLNDLMDVFKISSSDITNRPFIDYICQFGKPVILSTGASRMEEVEEAVEWIENHENPLALLHCVLNYPTDEVNANLGMMLHLKERYPDKAVGYSDHTTPGDLKVLEVAALLGAEIIEKHFTHDKTLPGNDHYHAMDKTDLARFRERLERIYGILGDFDKHPLQTEEPARRNARRSLVAARHIPEGTILEHGDLTWKRPAHGISPKFLHEVLGRKAKRSIEKDELLQWELIDGND